MHRYIVLGGKEWRNSHRTRALCGVYPFSIEKLFIYSDNVLTYIFRNRLVVGLYLYICVDILILPIAENEMPNPDIYTAFYI